jgi:hypothetical protein
MKPAEQHATIAGPLLSMNVYATIQLIIYPQIIARCTIISQTLLAMSVTQAIGLIVTIADFAQMVKAVCVMTTSITGPLSNVAHIVMAVNSSWAGAATPALWINIAAGWVCARQTEQLVSASILPTEPTMTDATIGTTIHYQ